MYTSVVYVTCSWRFVHVYCIYVHVYVQASCILLCLNGVGLSELTDVVRMWERAQVILVINVKKSIQWLVLHKHLFSLGVECVNRACVI